MAITPLPPPPSRADPANFAARGDAFLGALPTFQNEANILAQDVNETAILLENSIPSIEAAIGLSNYRGEYNAGTTYLIGQSVSYLNNFYIAKVTTTGVLPTVTDNWQIIVLATNVPSLLLINLGVI